MSRVLVVGSANIDFTVALPRLPLTGETVTGGTLLVNHGGKGANQAVAARRLSAEVRLIACLGDDPSGHGIRDALAAEGIDVTGLAWTREAATGTALIVVDAEGRNQIAVAPGANWKLDVELARKGVANIRWADVVVCQLETPVPTVRWVLGEARRHGVTTILNPAPVPGAPLAISNMGGPDMAPQPPQRSERPGEAVALIDLWPLVDYLTPNAGEAGRLSGVAVTDRATAAEAAAMLRRRGVATVVVTLGADGALVASAAGMAHVPGVTVTAIDTTAAGDTFNAALAVGLGEGRALGDALRFANAAAALACTRRGAQPSLPSRAEVARFF